MQGIFPDYIMKDFSNSCTIARCDNRLLIIFIIALRKWLLRTHIKRIIPIFNRIIRIAGTS